MKNLSTFLIGLFSLLIFSVQSQELDEIGTIPFDNSVLLNPPKTSHKSTLCDIDTVRYALAKGTGFASLNINSATSASAGGQYFDAPQSLTIHGADFYAYAISQPSVTVNVSLYTAGADSLPFGAPLRTTTLVVDSNFGGGQLNVLRKTAIFPSPITLSVPYVIVVENNTATEMGLVSTAYTAADGGQEWLSSLALGGAWLRSYNVNVNSTTPFDADWLIHPIVRYSVKANFNPVDQCLNPTGSTTKTFTNTSSNILYHRMYNQAAFLDATRFSFIWDFGDSSPLLNAIDTNHTYTTPGTYNVSLSDSMYAWTSVCYDDTVVQLTSTADASFNVALNALELSFTPIDSNTVDYFWDFGDGDTSSLAYPTHVYASPGTYNVCLTATNACTSDLVCDLVTVTCQNPIADFTWMDSLYTVDFTNTSLALSGGDLFWDFGDGDTSNLTNPTHVFANSGPFTVCLTATSVCGSNTSCEVIDVTCPLPQIDFRIDPTGTDDLSFLFSDSSTVIGTPSYNWDFGDGNSSIQASEDYSYATAGTYRICLSVTDFCGMDSACTTLNVGTNTSILDLTSAGIQWYPNPSLGQLYLFAEQQDAEATVSIRNMLGQTVFSQALKDGLNELELSHLPNAWYFIQVNKENQQWVDKVYIE